MQEDKNKIKIYLQIHQFIWIIASNFTHGLFFIWTYISDEIKLQDIYRNLSVDVVEGISIFQYWSLMKIK